MAGAGGWKPLFWTTISAGAGGWNGGNTPSQCRMDSTVTFLAPAIPACDMLVVANYLAADRADQHRGVCAPWGVRHAIVYLAGL
jgi:hypothetical protein